MTPRSINAWPRARTVSRPVAARLVGLIGVVVAALLLSACGSVNAGSDSERDLRRAFAEDPAIESMDLRVANDLPWVGGVSGDIIAKEGLSEADLRGLIDRLAEFSAGHEGGRVSVGVISDGVQFPVAERKSAREAYLEFGLSLRDDPRVGSVEFDAGRSLLVTAEDPAAVFELAAALPGMLAPLPTEMTDLELRSSDGAVSLDGAPGRWLVYAQRVWMGAAQYGATALHATPESFELRVQREQDVQDAHNFAAHTLARSQLQLTVSSDMLGVASGAGGEAARTLLAALTDDAVSKVMTSWTNDEVLQIAVASPEDAQMLADELSRLQQSRTFGTLALFVHPSGAFPGEPAKNVGDEMLSVYADPRELSTQIANARHLLAEPGAQQVSIARDRVELSVADSVGESNLAEYAADLKSVAATGQWTCVSTVSGSALCATAKPTISLDDIGYEEHESARGFVQQWNAAP